MIKKIKKLKSIYKEVKGFPIVKVILENNAIGKKLYSSFNSRHPKYFFIGKKTIGVALIEKEKFSSAAEYIQSVNGKNSAAYYSRKAKAAGCVFTSINANDYAEEIHAIHLSAESRQGKKLDTAYENKIANYPVDDNNLYFGILKENKLIAYLWIVKSGDLLLMNRIMGHSQFLDFGTMYLLVTSFVEFSYQLDSKIIMYDTMLGGTEGLKLFKKRCGFKPCRVNWSLEK